MVLGKTESFKLVVWFSAQLSRSPEYAEICAHGEINFNIYEKLLKHKRVLNQNFLKICVRKYIFSSIL